MLSSSATRAHMVKHINHQLLQTSIECCENNRTMSCSQVCIRTASQVLLSHFHPHHAPTAACTTASTVRTCTLQASRLNALLQLEGHLHKHAGTCQPATDMLPILFNSDSAACPAMVGCQHNKCTNRASCKTRQLALLTD